MLKRAGHTEAAVDLARMAGLYPAGVLCEIVNDDGTMARVPDLVQFCKEHDLLLISIAELIRYRRQTEKLVKRVTEARIPTDVGRLHLLRLRVGARRRAARRHGQGRGAGRGQRARPGALRVPHRRRLRLAALRLRHPARPGHEAHLRGRPRRGRLPPGPRGPRHRHRPQDPGLLPAGPGHGHRRGQRGPRPPGRQPRVRHRRPDPRRPRHHHDAAT